MYIQEIAQFDIQESKNYGKDKMNNIFFNRCENFSGFI